MQRNDAETQLTPADRRPDHQPGRVQACLPAVCPNETKHALPQYRRPPVGVLSETDLFACHANNQLTS